MNHHTSRPSIERLFYIHFAIQSGQMPNATTLAKKLECSAKTVQRDIEFMRDRLRFPIEYDETKWGYYYAKPTTPRPGPFLTLAWAI